MRLVSVHVENYKSVRDSQPFDIGDVTCLVGKNESGKTTLLEAIVRLNPVIDAKAKLDVTEDYPRSKVEEYNIAIEQKKQAHADVITAVFSLDAQETAPVKAEFGDNVFRTATVTVSRGYSNQSNVVVDVNERAATHRLIDDAGLPPELAAQTKTQGTFRDLLEVLSAHGKTQDAAFANAHSQANAIQDAQERAKALDDSKKLSESEASKQLRAKLTELLKEGLSLHVWNKHLKHRMPKFLYFDEYYQMEGQLNIQKLRERQSNSKLLDSDHAMLALIDLARLKLDELAVPRNTQALLNKLEGASNYLSDQIFKYWSQNKNLRIRFDIRPALAEDPEGMREGMNVWGFVYDSAHEATVRLGTRSRGFIWFFSFLAWFSQQKKSGHPLVLLLDEPGLFLHASAQSDLLRYIEAELKPHHQVIYTTHSPFMVDPKHFDRVRIVRDKSMEAKTRDEPIPEEQEGTKVLTDVLEADEGSLFPLQGALAYDITQTMFVGPNSLVVEGVSDMFYIETMTGVLERAKREGLSEKWTLSPVGGADKVSSFIALFRNQKGLNLATLIDFQKKDQQKIENIYKEKLLQKKQVLTFAQFTKTSEADIEDMFDVGFYLELVNAEYKDQLAAPITEAMLTERHPRVLVRLEAFFSKAPLRTGYFNHYRPARYFAEHVAELSPKLLAPTLDRYESAFKALNTLLQ